MTAVPALQKALAAEHAAVYLYGVLGAQTSKSAQSALFHAINRTYAAHRAVRDELTVMIGAHGADPVAALVDYAPPGPTDTPDQVRAVARTVERRVGETYGELVAHTSGRDRSWAVHALAAAALQAVTFGARPTSFPGL